MIRMPAPFDIDRLREARAGAHFGAVIEYFAVTDSTNMVAHQLAQTGAAEGTVVIADTQTHGRGRLGRAWVSPPSCNLYLSVVLRPSVSTAIAPQLTLVAGVAVAETIREWVPRAALKWPNDTVIDGRKVAGILTEMDADADRVRFVILGIGVNLNSAPEDFPAELQDKATSLRVVTGGSIDRAAFTGRLLAQLEDRYQRFLHDGFAGLRPFWEACSCLTGQQVAIDEGGQRRTGVVIGIADDGALVLRTPQGAEKRILVGDVTVIDGYESTKQRSALSEPPAAQRRPADG